MENQHSTEQRPEVSDADARRLAAEYHDGALLALASTGTINQAVRLEVERDLKRTDWSPQQRRELEALASYLGARADRGVVEGWESLPWSDLAGLRNNTTPLRNEGARSRREGNPRVIVVENLSGSRSPEVWTAPIDDVLMWAESKFAEDVVLYRETTLRDEAITLGVEVDEYLHDRDLVEAIIAAVGGEAQESGIAAELRESARVRDTLERPLVNSDYLAQGGAKYTFEPIDVGGVITNAFAELPGTNRVCVYESTEEALEMELTDDERKAVVQYIAANELSPSEKLFYENAPYSYNPKKETEEEGRLRCAREAASAEAEAKRRGWSVEFERDGTILGEQEGVFDVILHPATFRGDTYDGYDARLLDSEGRILAALGGVTFSENTDNSPDERRLIMTALAQEVIDAEIKQMLTRRSPQI